VDGILSPAETLSGLFQLQVVTAIREANGLLTSDFEVAAHPHYSADEPWLASGTDSLKMVAAGGNSRPASAAHP